MDFTPVGFQDSPPYRPEEDSNFFSVPDSELSVWDSLSLITPPLTPVDTTSNDKEVIRHLSSHESRAITELPEENFLNSCVRDLGREASPAILNDIMWNSGQKHKRPDSAMDIDVRFNLNGTPLSFEQPITNTFVDTAELFSFSLFENCVNSESQHGTDDESECDNAVSSPFQDFSDSEEEIDVVSIQDETEPKSTFIPQTTHQTTTRHKPKITLQKGKDKKEESSTSDSDCEVTRISHNDLERKRRNELRDRFNCLRESLPSLSNNDKAAKITILRKAYELIPGLQKEEQKLLTEKEQQRRKNAELLKKLSKLSSVTALR